MICLEYTTFRIVQHQRKETLSIIIIILSNDDDHNVEGRGGGGGDKDLMIRSAPLMEEHIFEISMIHGSVFTASPLLLVVLFPRVFALNASMESCRRLICGSCLEFFEIRFMMTAFRTRSLCLLGSCPYFFGT